MRDDFSLIQHHNECLLLNISGFQINEAYFALENFTAVWFSLEHSIDHINRYFFKKIVNYPINANNPITHNQCEFSILLRCKILKKK